jgi:hypothetical protein
MTLVNAARLATAARKLQAVPMQPASTFEVRNLLLTK